MNREEQDMLARAGQVAEELATMAAAAGEMLHELSQLLERSTRPTAPGLVVVPAEQAHLFRQLPDRLEQL